MTPNRTKGAAFKRTAQYKKMMAGLHAWKKRHAHANKAKAKKAVDYNTTTFPQPKPRSAAGVFQRKFLEAPESEASRRRVERAIKTGPWKHMTVGRGAKAKHVSLLRKQIGGKVYKTYLYKTAKGKVRRLPDYMQAGFPTAAARAKFVKAASAADAKPGLKKRLAALTKRGEKLTQRRVRRAQRLLDRARKGLPVDIFTPNAMSYSEWSRSMTPNKAKKKSKKRRSAAQKAASKRNIKKAIAAHKRSHARKRSSAKKAGKSRRRVAKKAHKAARRVARKRNAKGQFTRNGKAVANRRRRRHHRNGAMAVTPNRRRRHRRHHRNFGGTDFKALLMTGLAVGAGFAAHRAIRHVVQDKVISQIDAFKSGDAAKYSGMLSSAATVLVGVSALQMVKGSVGAAGKQAILEAQGGMVASVILDLVSQALGMSPETKGAQAYLNGFGEYVPMSGFGEYVPMSGLGSYYSLSGLGAISQAAAGMGAISQAAAGMGAISQAAAGVPLSGSIYEAAAGFGEYFPSATDKMLLTKNLPISGFGADTSLQPTLSAAERALTVAEAVAGLGEDTIEKPIVDAWQVPENITDPDKSDSRNYGTLSPFVNDALQDPEDVDDEAKGLRQGVLAGGSFG